MQFKVYQEGEILYDKDSECYVDQLNPEFPKIHKRHFLKYLKSKYDLTTEEYYNLVVHGDKDRKLICPVCGGIQEFNSLMYPYHKCCINCRRDYNFTKEEDVKNYLVSIGMPLWTEEQYINKLMSARIRVIINSFKGSGDESDIIMKELKKSNRIKRSTISDYISKGLLKPRYSNRTNLYEYLINKGFLPYEVQFLIINDL